MAPAYGPSGRALQVRGRPEGRNGSTHGGDVFAGAGPAGKLWACWHHCGASRPDKVRPVATREFSPQRRCTSLVLDMSSRSRQVAVDVESLSLQKSHKFFDLCFVFKPKQLDEDELELYSKWLDAKVVKDFEKADQYRAELIQKGII